MKSRENLTYRFCLIGIFLIGLATYSILATKMTVPLFRYNDEELYISIAKSIYYKGNISRFYEIIGYDCILYPLLISFAYIFYSPEHILTIIRLIGVIVMTSVVFPSYFLANNILQNKKKALYIAVISILIPEMIYTSYALQETLFYPLFMWTILLINSDFQTNKINNIRSIGICIMLYLLYLTKTYAIVFFISYVGSLVIVAINERDKHILSKIIKVIIFFFIIYISGKVFLYIFNEMQTGNTHYSSQIRSIFPITITSIYNIFKGSLFYVYYVLFCMGFVPLLIPISNIKRYVGSDRKFVLFLLISILFVIEEIVISIFLPENSNELYPLRVHFRYFFVFFVPFLIMMFKIEQKNININFIVYILIIGMCAYTLIFFDGTNQNGKQSPIDGLVTSLLKSYSSRFLGFNQSFSFILVLLLLILLYLYYKDKVKYVIKALYFILPIALLGIFMVNHSIPYKYYNNGIELQEDFITFANYINDKNSNIVYINSKTDAIEDAIFFSDYIKDDYQYARIEDIQKDGIMVENDDTYIIISSDNDFYLTGAEQVDLNVSYVKVYLADKGELQIVRKPVLKDAWEDGWINKGSYIEYPDESDIKSIELKIYFSPIIKDGSIKAILVDDTGSESRITFDESTNLSQVIKVYRNDISSPFVLHLDSEGFAVPKNLNLNEDTRELSYLIKNIEIVK